MLEVLTKVSTILTPVLLLIFAGAGWMIRQTISRKNKLELALRSDRLKIYNDLVHPFILLFSNENTIINRTDAENFTPQELAVRIITTIEYKETVFKLLLFGSDGVVKAHNELMQFFYCCGVSSDEAQNGHIKMLELLGGLLLEIRKSTGNGATRLSNIQMLESIITDIRKINTKL